MFLDGTLTYLSAVLSFLGVLLGLLIVGVFSISDRLGLYRVQSIDLARHLKKILEIYGEDEASDVTSKVPKGIDRALESLASLLRVTIYFSAAAGVGVAAEMVLLLVSGTSSPDILGAAIAAAFTALAFSVVESVRLVMSVAEISRIFGKLQSVLVQLNSGKLRLKTKDGKMIDYRVEDAEV